MDGKINEKTSKISWQRYQDLRKEVKKHGPVAILNRLSSAEKGIENAQIDITIMREIAAKEGIKL